MRSFPVYGRACASAAALVLAVLSFVSPPTITPASAASATTGAGCLPGSIKATLNAIRSKFGPVTIVSTFRRGARIAGSGRASLHASCRAVDFHPPKGKYKTVLAYLQKTHSGGLGTYSCGMHHLHIDNGPKVRFHHCVSSSGRIAKAGKRKSKRSKAYGSLKKGKAQAFIAQGQGRKAKRKRTKKVYASPKKAQTQAFVAQGQSKTVTR